MDDLQNLINTKLTRPTEPKPTPVRAKRPTAKTYKKEAQSQLEFAVGAANMNTTAIQTYPRRLQEAYRYFEEAVGGRQELIQVLKHCPESSPAYKPLMRLFRDVDFSEVGKAMLDVVCQKNDVNLATVVQAFKEAKSAQLSVDAINILAKKFPTVVAQIGTDATNRYEDCPVCEGNTRVPRIGDNGEWALDENGAQRTQLCYQCRGTGKVFKEHDTTNRKFFLELTGVLGGDSKRNQTAVQINQTFKGDFTPGDGSFEHLIKAIDTPQLPTTTAATNDIIDVPFSDYENPIMSPDPAQDSEGN